MSVDPVKFDNPLRRDSLSTKPMTFGFVPRALPLVNGLCASSGFVLIAIYAFVGVCIAWDCSSCRGRYPHGPGQRRLLGVLVALNHLDCRRDRIPLLLDQSPTGSFI